MTDRVKQNPLLSENPHWKYLCYPNNESMAVNFIDIKHFIASNKTTKLKYICENIIPSNMPPYTFSFL